ncbi:hypothetical protein Ancab_035331 [Ancistrocladus abbreviatus]
MKSSMAQSICGLFVCLVSILLLLLSQGTNSEPTQDRQALLSFLSQVPHSKRVNWNSSDSACNWVGVTCDATRSYVYTLRLPGAGLVGRIPPGTIGRLSRLRVLSLRSNGLSGGIPEDLSNLTLLRSLYLQNNQLSGEFPTSATQLTRLNRLDLSGNQFSGEIPFSVNNLTHLTGLFLENNNFSGNLPSISASLQDFNVSNNNLNGSIPRNLARFPQSSFAGNLQLCGSPLPPCNSTFFPPPAPAPSSIVPSSPAETSHHKKLSTGAIIGIAIAAAFVLLILLLCLILCLVKRRRKDDRSKTQKQSATGAGSAPGAEAGTSSSKDDLTSGAAEGGERNKLVFLNGGGVGGYSFDLEDLLRASAEVLGKGSVGTSYKAVLEEGTTVVVKRLKDVAAAKREFELHMEVLGKCKHENVVPLRAYYYSKDEKLLVCDYMPNGSLSALLHGSRGSGRTPLDWDNRMRVALGAAKGLTYLHESGKVVHGNIKSSNVLLRQDNNACVCDFGLRPLFSNATPPNRIAGYRAPEVIETRKVTFKSDVYSFGVLLLELLTGKAPNQASLGEEGIDLPRWVQSVVREEWTAEVFDVELMRYNNIEEEMVQLLQIAMACVSIVPDQRPSMPEVLRMMEDMNRSETDDALRQSSDDPSKGSDGQTPPIESRTPPSSVTP